MCYQIKKIKILSNVLPVLLIRVIEYGLLQQSSLFIYIRVASFISIGNQGTRIKTTDLSQVTDTLYHKHQGNREYAATFPPDELIFGKKFYYHLAYFAKYSALSYHKIHLSMNYSSTAYSIHPLRYHDIPSCCFVVYM
jgi:hypothetical protein